MKGQEGSALGGLRVLDLAGGAGVFCTKLLADMGADVVKIEPPQGDVTRGSGPFMNDIPHPERSLYFWYYNTDKRGITLNLEVDEGCQIFHRLAKAADVIVDTFPPGKRKPELGWEALSQLNPRLIVVSITPFGQTGPYKEYHSCDIVASALGGQMYVCGEPHTPPLKPYGEQTYLIASFFGALGILLALHYRNFTGLGQYIDVSMHECVAATIEHVNVRYLYDKVIAKRQGSLQWNNAFRIFRCKDGYILLSLFQQWDTLIEWLDSEGMAADLTDEKWRRHQVRLGGIEHIIQVLERWTQTHTVNELVEQGQLMHFPWAPVDSLPQLVANPQLIERGFFVELAHPELGARVKYPRAGAEFSRSPWRLVRCAPLIGEHNQQIYGEELGFSAQRLAALEEAGVI